MREGEEKSRKDAWRENMKKGNKGIVYRGHSRVAVRSRFFEVQRILSVQCQMVNNVLEDSSSSVVVCVLH